MRFIHTADWHLGNRMHDINREQEFEEFLNWLTSQIIETKAQAVVVAGDVFDVVNPPVEARRLYYRFLANVASTDCANVIVVGGNHDSSYLLDASKELLNILNIKVVGSVANLTPDQMVFELKDKSGEAVGICCAVPFAREEELRQFMTEKAEDGKFYDAGYKALYAQVFEQAEKLRAGRNIPVIATGHLYAADLEGRRANVSQSEKIDDGTKPIDIVGNLGNVHSDVFPAELDYVALGHIHYSSMVAKNPKIRYSGSPFLLGFDEWLLRREILLVDSEHCQLPEVKKIQVPSSVVYERIEGTIDEIDARLKEYSEKKFEKKVYLELSYKREADRNIQTVLEETINSLPENLEVVSWRPVEEFDHNQSDFEEIDMSEIKSFDEKEIFTRLILIKNHCSADSEKGKALIEKYLPLFMQVAAEV